MPRVAVATRYPEDRAKMLEALASRRAAETGDSEFRDSRSRVVELALDRLLASEGFIDEGDVR